jgi:hypothetical protein
MLQGSVPVFFALSPREVCQVKGRVCPSRDKRLAPLQNIHTEPAEKRIWTVPEIYPLSLKNSTAFGSSCFALCFARPSLRLLAKQYPLDPVHSI